jgi:hypothetical protein
MCHLIYWMHWTNWRRGANFRKWFQSFDRSDLHYFSCDFTSEVTGPRSIISMGLWSIGSLLGGRQNYLGLQSSSGVQVQQRVIHLVDHLFTDPLETLPGVLYWADLQFGIFFGVFGGL